MKIINFIKRYHKKIAILLFFLLCLICGIYFYGKIVQVIPADIDLFTTAVLQAEKQVFIKKKRVFIFKAINNQ